MTTSTCCTIQLLNKSYSIKCPDHEQNNLQLAAQKLNEQLLKNKDAFKALDDFKALVLAALHISHALVTCEAQQLAQRQQLTQFINALEKKIGHVAESESS